ncbi:hypothetical protein RMSM_05607 [Rhodopirellula maiorica SM1]|uniref:Uncharacterized protein n=1 Tax=Rhodopirellula maiorica SM1 TaxID=1265738 RepID=M5RU11_9BACT|nr:hypothetical protein RMSM_05607 [Rhodopirellula maiorica SM1]
MRSTEVADGPMLAPKPHCRDLGFHYRSCRSSIPGRPALICSVEGRPRISRMITNGTWFPDSC